MTDMHVREEQVTADGPNTITYLHRAFHGPALSTADLLAYANLEAEARWTLSNRPDVTAVKTVLVVDGVDIAEHGPVSR